MVAGKTVCLRRLSRGDRALEVRFNRFLGHDKVTAERIIESWGESTVAAVEGRHVLAIQDTSEIHFNTTPQRRRGLGEIGKGNNYCGLSGEHRSCCKQQHIGPLARERHIRY